MVERVRKSTSDYTGKWITQVSNYTGFTVFFQISQVFLFYIQNNETNEKLN